MFESFCSAVHDCLRLPVFQRLLSFCLFNLLPSQLLLMPLRLPASSIQSTARWGQKQQKEKRPSTSTGFSSWALLTSGEVHVQALKTSCMHSKSKNHLWINTRFYITTCLLITAVHHLNAHVHACSRGNMHLDQSTHRRILNLLRFNQASDAQQNTHNTRKHMHS